MIDGNYIRGANGRSGEIGFMRAHRAEGDRDAQLQHIVSLSALSRVLAGEG